MRLSIFQRLIYLPTTPPLPTVYSPTKLGTQIYVAAATGCLKAENNRINVLSFDTNMLRHGDRDRP